MGKEGKETDEGVGGFRNLHNTALTVKISSGVAECQRACSTELETERCRAHRRTPGWTAITTGGVVSMGHVSTSLSTRAWESHLELVAVELSVTVSESLQVNGKLDVAAAHDVLELELGAELPQNTCSVARRQARVVLLLCPCHKHCARCRSNSRIYMIRMIMAAKR